MTTAMHNPVLLNEAMEALSITPNGWYIDGTYGRGGHTRAILVKLSAQGRVLAIDKDEAAVSHAKQEWREDPRVVIEQGSFAQLSEFALRHGMRGQVAGILLDLGVSSPQLDNAERGFSFLHDGPLDMRMDQRTGTSAASFIAECDEQTLIHILKEYGEEKFARRIAHAILKARDELPITRTQQLAEIIKRAVPKKEPNKNPATRTFQALRIWVNNELEDLRQGLVQAVDVLAPHGRLAVISFHSLEDRIVKHFIRGEVHFDLPREIPFPLVTKQSPLKAVGKAIRASDAEVRENPRSRSAIMRVAEKV
jgi:16S rRNA (cytosine1402-N4)-methyltransferase